MATARASAPSVVVTTRCSGRAVAIQRVRSPSLLVVGDVVAGVRAAAASHAA